MSLRLPISIQVAQMLFLWNDNLIEDLFSALEQTQQTLREVR